MTSVYALLLQNKAFGYFIEPIAKAVILVQTGIQKILQYIEKTG
jgi:hypothetical protein